MINTGNVTVPIFGADQPEHVEAILDAATIRLTEAEMTYLDEPYRPRDMINDYNPVRRARALSVEPTSLSAVA